MIKALVIQIESPLTQGSNLVDREGNSFMLGEVISVQKDENILMFSSSVTRDNGKKYNASAMLELTNVRKYVGCLIIFVEEGFKYLQLKFDPEVDNAPITNHFFGDGNLRKKI